MPGGPSDGEAEYELNYLHPYDVPDGARTPDGSQSQSHPLHQLHPQSSSASSTSVSSRPRVRLTIWTIAAATSLVSTKRLLVRENYHYPWTLLMLHLLLISFSVIGPRFLSFLRDLSTLLRCRSLRRPTARGLLSPIWFLFAAVPGALSLPLLFQAILHFPNLPTFVMLSSIAFMSESIFVHFSHSFSILRAFNPRVLYMAFTSWVMLYDEYRLEPWGLVCGISALLLAGLSTLQFKNARGGFGASRGGRGPSPSTQLLHISLPLALIATISANVWLQLENPWIALAALTGVKSFLLLVNVVSTAVAMIAGGSLLIPPMADDDTSTNLHPTAYYVPAPPRMVASLTHVGLVALSSTLFTRRAYSSWVQLLAYVGFLLVTVGPTQTISRRMRQVSNYIRTPSPSPRRGSFPDSRADRVDRLSRHSRRTGSDLVGFPPSSPMENGFGEGTASNKHLNLNKSRPYLRRSASGSPAIGPPPSVRAASPVPRDMPSLSAVAGGLFCWIFFVLLNFEYITLGKPYRPYRPTLDRFYEPRSDFDIVINMYKEPVEEVASLIEAIKDLPDVGEMRGRVVVYVKDETADPWALQQALGVETIHKLPNHGREADAYLNHITYNWDDLARHTLFMQAGVHNREQFFNRIQDYWNEDTGFLSLGFSGAICEDCTSCGDRFGWEDTFGVLSKAYGRVYNHKCGPVVLTYKGQFIVSGQRIHGTELRIYEEFRDALVSADSWAHSYEFVGDNPDSMEAPFLGYTLERIWGMLFQCSNLDLGWKCPTLLSGTRRGGDPGDCQCLDSKPQKILD